MRLGPAFRFDGGRRKRVGVWLRQQREPGTSYVWAAYLLAVSAFAVAAYTIFSGLQ